MLGEMKTFHLLTQTLFIGNNASATHFHRYPTQFNSFSKETSSNFYYKVKKMKHKLSLPSIYFAFVSSKNNLFREFFLRIVKSTVKLVL